MEDSDQIPDERASLKHMGEVVAEAWYEAEGKSPILVLRIPRERFQTADSRRQVTIENLLKAAAVSNDEVESWRLEGFSHFDMSEDSSELIQPLPPPLESRHLTVYVHLKPPAPSDAPNESGMQEIPLEKWQGLEACWKVILGLEASIDSARLSGDGLRSEMENAAKKNLSVEEKLNALQSDVAQVNKVKSRIHHAVPKLREFIHRATWALATPERKRLGDLYKDEIEPRNPLTDVDKLRAQMEHLQKDRQVLLAQGNTVYQECRGVVAELQRAISTLQRNAVDNARRKRDAKNQKGKQF